MLVKAIFFHKTHLVKSVEKYYNLTQKCYQIFKMTPLTAGTTHINIVGFLKFY